jgi:1-acyl-sn-glycerol-3-phosphate acyltransferase
VTVLNPENLPKKGPVIYLALHRNGAADGFVYHSVLPRISYMIARQLRDNPFLRIFFGGIEVVRQKDIRPGEHIQALNKRAMQECVDTLHANGELLIFPEGTSTLGPSHLPFKSGGVRIAAAFVASGKACPIVPIGVRYEQAWAFRSRAEVLIGKPIMTQTTEVRELKHLCNPALKEIGVNVTSERYQKKIQKLACIATLGTSHSYYRVLKRFESSIPEALDKELSELELLFTKRRLMFHQGVPLFPMGARWPYALALMVCAPVVGIAVLLNFLPLAGAWFAANKFADDQNVVALWKILVGVPLAAIWALVLTLLSLIDGSPWLLLAYAGITSLGLSLFYRTRKLLITVHNGLLQPSLRPRLLAFRDAILAALDRPPSPLTTETAP